MPNMLAQIILFLLLVAPSVPAATTELVSVGLGGLPADGASDEASLTPDGRWVVFSSLASNLVAGDTNTVCDNDGNEVFDEPCSDIFVRDRQTSTTTRVSVDSMGAQANGASTDADISADGRWVVFSSAASNLVTNDTNDRIDCFLHDNVNGTTERVSVTDSEGQADGDSVHCRVSDDGRFVVFSSKSMSFTPFDSFGDVFLRDRQLQTTTLLSFGGSLFGDNDCWDGDNFNPSISDDGRLVLFTHQLDPSACDTDTIQRLAFLYDREQATWKQVALRSGDLSVAGPLDFASAFPFRIFPPNDFIRLYLRDLVDGGSEEIGVSSTGERANDTVGAARVTSDRRFVVFSSRANNLVPGDTNGCAPLFVVCDDVFVRDREAGTTERVSVTVSGGEADARSSASGLSADATIVLFTSEATNLVLNDSNGQRDVFVRAAVCGDGTVDRGEECDDGNVTSSDGCSAICRLDCPATPRTGCRLPVQSGKASVQLVSKIPSSKNKLQWKWVKGDVTSKAAFGYPTGSDGYRLCIYDGNGLATTMAIPPGAGWKEKPTSFNFKRKSAQPDGVIGMQLKEGVVAGKAKIQIKAKGALIPMPALDTLATPVTVQLSNTLPVPECWEAVYSAPFGKQTTAQFRDKAD